MQLQPQSLIRRSPKKRKQVQQASGIKEKKERRRLPFPFRKEGGGWHKRRRRDPKPKRTPEEIAAIRAERAAKKARLALENAETTA